MTALTPAEIKKLKTIIHEEADCFNLSDAEIITMAEGMAHDYARDTDELEDYLKKSYFVNRCLAKLLAHHPL
jgi:hypothetical protein